jgi:tight adherence protein B
MASELFNFKDLPLVILTLTIFLSFFFLIRALLLYLNNPARSHQRRLKQRLKVVEGGEPTHNLSTLLKKNSLDKSAMQLSLDKFRLLDHLQSLMRRANPTWKLSTFLTVAALVGLAGMVIGLAQWGVWGGFAGSALGLFIPYKFLVHKGKKRLQRFEKQLPEALDLLARGLRAGHAFPQGLKQVATEIPDPLGTEFLITYSEFSHGVDFSNAILGLGKRVELRDLSFFTTAVLIQRETGGNLTEVLEKIAVLIRERFQLRNQVLALTAEGRFSGFILMALPPALLINLMVINPEYASVLIDHPTGRLMCYAAVSLQFLGYLCIRKIVNIKV